MRDFLRLITLLGALLVWSGSISYAQPNKPTRDQRKQAKIDRKRQKKKEREARKAEKEAFKRHYKIQCKDVRKRLKKEFKKANKRNKKKQKWHDQPNPVGPTALGWKSKGIRPKAKVGAITAPSPAPWLLGKSGPGPPQSRRGHASY